MADSSTTFSRLDVLWRQAGYVQWHRQQRKQQILRSQHGFTPIEASPALSGKPPVCEGCIYYHGITYGYSRSQRNSLICGFHPYGWEEASPCPDWQGE